MRQIKLAIYTRQLLGARKYSLSYRIVFVHIALNSLQSQKTVLLFILAVEFYLLKLIVATSFDVISASF